MAEQRTTTEFPFLEQIADRYRTISTKSFPSNYPLNERISQIQNTTHQNTMVHKTEQDVNIVAARAFGLR
jgi:hypothetical protein